MKIGTLLVYLMMVSCIVFILYYTCLYRTKSSLTNTEGEFITKDAGNLLKAASKISSDSNDEKSKEEIERRVNSLMKKYNIK